MLYRVYLKYGESDDFNESAKNEFTKNSFVFTKLWNVKREGKISIPEAKIIIKEFFMASELYKELYGMERFKMFELDQEKQIGKSYSKRHKSQCADVSMSKFHNYTEITQDLDEVDGYFIVTVNRHNYENISYAMEIEQTSIEVDVSTKNIFDKAQKNIKLMAEINQNSQYEEIFGATYLAYDTNPGPLKDEVDSAYMYTYHLIEENEENQISKKDMSDFILTHTSLAKDEMNTYLFELLVNTIESINSIEDLNEVVKYNIPKEDGDM